MFLHEGCVKCAQSDYDEREWLSVMLCMNVVEAPFPIHIFKSKIVMHNIIAM